MNSKKKVKSFFQEDKVAESQSLTSNSPGIATVVEHALCRGRLALPLRERLSCQIPCHVGIVSTYGINVGDDANVPRPRHFWYMLLLRRRILPSCRRVGSAGGVSTGCSPPELFMQPQPSQHHHLPPETKRERIVLVDEKCNRW